MRKTEITIEGNLCFETKPNTGVCKGDGVMVGFTREMAGVKAGLELVKELVMGGGCKECSSYKEEPETGT